MDLGSSTIAGTPIVDLAPQGELDFGNVTIGGGVTIDGDATIGGKLSVDDIILSGGIELPGGGALDLDLGNITVSGDASFGGGAKIDGLTVEGGIETDTINTSGDVTVGGNLLVDQIGNDCSDDLIIASTLLSNCLLKVRQYDSTNTTLVNNHTSLIAEAASTNADFEQVLQERSGTIALLDDVLTTEAVYLVGAADLTTDTTDLATLGLVRPGESTAVNGDTIINNVNGTLSAEWKLLIGNPLNLRDSDEMILGDKIVFVPSNSRPDWIFLPTPVKIDLGYEEDTANEIGKVENSTGGTEAGIPFISKVISDGVGTHGLIDKDSYEKFTTLEGAINVDSIGSALTTDEITC